MIQSSPLRVLVLGASYGLLAAIKITLAGHLVTLVCRQSEADLFIADGARVLIPTKDRKDNCLLAAPVFAGGARTVGAMGIIDPINASPDQFDLAVFAMAEPQFAAPEIASLIEKIGKTGLPCLSLMNMLPIPYLAGLGLGTAKLAPAYGSFDVWKMLRPNQLTAASPDPQAVRHESGRPNDLKVTLASNFKIAPFVSTPHQSIIARLAYDVDHSGTVDKQTAVRFVAHKSRFVALAKWPMLIAGNCRCLRNGAPVSIAQAVHSDLATSRQIYNWVANIVREIGADENDIVPFDRYASAAQSLSLSSSLARALFARAQKVERVDLLVSLVAQSLGHQSAALDKIVGDIETTLDRNRA